MISNPLLGTLLHSFGAMAAALCYTPQQKLRGWSWQTYWLTQAAVCWLIAPLIGAWLTIPNLGTVLSEAPSRAMLFTFLLGMVYGVGGTAFGMAIRHLGYSLTYAIAIGISCVLGTLAGPVLAGTLGSIMDQKGSGMVIGGMMIGLVGISFCGFAGHSKEKDIQAADGPKSFSLIKGVPLCLLAGVLSAIYGVAINDAAAPIADAAEKYGAGQWKTNVNYIFSNSGAFVTTFFFSLYLIVKKGTFGEYFKADHAAPMALPMNYLLAILTGILWYTQFFFYGLGHVRMGDFKFSSWAIHMIMLILFSSSAGLLMREWSGCRRKTQLSIFAALLILCVSIVVIGYGNYLGEAVGGH